MCNHYAKFDHKGMETVRVTDYTNQTTSKTFGRGNVYVQHSKVEKVFMKCVQNRRFQFQCVNKFEYRGMKKF